tara:strand:+ start:659 stop:1525 length:867 start_codon:yes stop_codon:yes gene_type:complete
MTDNKNICEINESKFQEKVLDASSSSLVLVDFWAPWCGPCKQLTPILEKIISNSDGKVKLIKINIDENQKIASQLNIQSIPAVFAFKEGQPIDTFQGVIPEKKILEFIEKSLGEKLQEDLTEHYNNASKLIEDKKFEEAKDLLEGFIAEYPNEYKGMVMYIDCLISLNQIKNAELFIESLNEKTLENSLIKSSIQKINIIKKNLEGPSVEELKNEIKKKPNDIKLILSLADKYFAENLLDEAFNLLLNRFNKNKEEVKAKFLEFFEALGNNNPKTLEYRKKFSSVMFS